MPTVQPGARQSRSLIPTLVASATMLVSIAVLAGWKQDATGLTGLMLGVAAPKPNAAVAFIFVSLALLLCAPGRSFERLSVPVLMLVGGACVIAVLTLTQYALDVDFGIDQILYFDLADATGASVPGRMAVGTGVSILLHSAALALYWTPSARSWQAAEGLVYLSMAVALMALVGHAYSVPGFTTLDVGTAMSIPTAALVLLIATAILWLDPRSFLVRRVVSSGPGGAMARRLLPIVILGVPFIGWLRVRGHDADFFGVAFGSALLVAVVMALLTAVILWVSVSLDTHAADLQAGVVTLQESEQRFRTLVLASAQMIWTTDPQGSVVEPVPTWQAYTGQSDEEVLGVGWVAAVHPDDVERSRAEWQRASATASTFVIERRLRRRDGVYRWFLTRCVPVVGPDGAIREWVASHMDIDDGKRMQEALVASDERLHMALKSAGVGTWSWDLVSHKITWDDYIHPLFGLKPGAFAGDDEHFLRLLHPDDRDRVVAQLDAASQGAGDYSSEYRVIWPDGSTHTISARGMVQRDQDGRAATLNGVCWDVTEERTLSAQLRQAQKMEAVGRLAGGIAHDFNNLLTAISGNSELLLEDLPEGDPRRAGVDEILKASSRAADLTRQLLAFSRRQVFAPLVLDLNLLIADLEKMLQRLIGEDVELATRFAADLGSVKADPGQIEQVLMNLVVNARDAMPQGGRLTIETANVELGDDYASRHLPVQLGPFVMLAVSDTGTGMDEGVRAQVFEPFYTTKAAGKGTGLGLSTAYGIVKQSGGFVWVYSEPGHGATFKVYLPRVDGAAAPHPAEARWEAMPRGDETVLVAEDDTAVRELIGAVLKRCGYRVLTAAGGDEALDLAARTAESVSLLITDVVMPAMSGRDLAASLQEARPGLRVLFMSGYTDDAVTRHGVFERKSAFLQKPFSGLSLARKVRATLDAA